MRLASEIRRQFDERSLFRDSIKYAGYSLMFRGYRLPPIPTIERHCHFRGSTAERGRVS